MKLNEAISAPRRLLRAAMPVTPPPPPNLRSSLALRRLSPLLLLAAALVALAVFFVHDSRPASAEHDTSVKELWSATMTVGSGGIWRGYRSPQLGGLIGQITNRDFTYDSMGYRIDSLLLFNTNSILQIQFNRAIPSSLKSAYTLHVGSREFPLTNATLAQSNQAAQWSNSGLSWSTGDTVELKLTRPTFIGVELFGSNLDTSNPDSAPTLTIEEGSSSTFMVKLTQAPTANVTVSLGRGQIRCAGCGEVWHDDVNAGTVSPTTMTFTSSNWQTGQTVTVTGVADDDSVHEHFQALVWVSSIASGADSDDPFRSPEAALGVYVTVTDGSDDGSQHGGL